MVLARAGLARLGRLDAVTEALDPIQMLPAPGQGALAVECRADDAATRALLAGLDDPATRAAVAAERAVLAALEAGCSAPVGAYAEVAEGDDGPELFLRAVVVSLDGTDDRPPAPPPARSDDPEGLGAPPRRRAGRPGRRRARRRRPGSPVRPPPSQTPAPPEHHRPAHHPDPNAPTRPERAA